MEQPEPEPKPEPEPEDEPEETQTLGEIVVQDEQDLPAVQRRLWPALRWHQAPPRSYTCICLVTKRTA